VVGDGRAAAGGVGADRDEVGVDVHDAVVDDLGQAVGRNRGKALQVTRAGDYDVAVVDHGGAVEAEDLDAVGVGGVDHAGVGHVGHAVGEHADAGGLVGGDGRAGVDAQAGIAAGRHQDAHFAKAGRDRDAATEVVDHDGKVVDGV